MPNCIKVLLNILRFFAGRSIFGKFPRPAIRTSTIRTKFGGVLINGHHGNKNPTLKNVSKFRFLCPELYIFSLYLILSLIQERNNFLIGCIVRLWIIAPLEIQKTEIFFFIDNKFKNGKFL